MRVLHTVCLAAAVSLLSSSAFAQEASTTRIETRPFYGASVTMERGVRVFRPLPPPSKVIINPEGKTPVYLGFEENRWTAHNTNTNTNYNYDRSSGSNDDGNVYGGVVEGRRHGRPGHRHHSAPRGVLGGNVR
jgi:hypothetical protein